MAVTTDTFFGNRGTIAVAGVTTYPASQTLAVVKGVEINVTFEHVELYGMSSIVRADVARHSAKVEVSIKYAKFDPTLATAAWPFFILDPTNATATFTGVIADTNTVKLFTVTANWVGTGARKMQAVVSNVYFESMPIPMPEHDFVVLDLKGYGDGITFTNPS
jgi:hypothetical protein